MKFLEAMIFELGNNATKMAELNYNALEEVFIMCSHTYKKPKNTHCKQGYADLHLWVKRMSH